MRIHNRKVILAAAISASVSFSAMAQDEAQPSKETLVDAMMVAESDFPLQPLADGPTTLSLPGMRSDLYYVPSNPDTIKWGYLPNQKDEPLMTIPSGATIAFDTMSHEGILEDQGRDPIAYFTSKGVPEDMVLDDAIAITQSEIEHDFAKDGPHVVTGPVAVEGAEPGDVLKVEILSLTPRVPYGVVSNRHGKGALPGEFPETEAPEEDASADNPEAYHNVSVFTPIRKMDDGGWEAIMLTEDGTEVVFPTAPFMGVMGVAADTDEPVHSVPPNIYGGNIDINDLVVGTTFYLPVFVDGANFYTGDPHMAQGDGEVALTALELSMRSSFRITLLKQGDEEIPAAAGSLEKPFGETPTHWIPIGLNEDLDEAMKDAVRESIRFLNDKLGMDRATALAYLSAATDYEVSQVVDGTKGIHGMIRKSDFDNITRKKED